MGLDMMAYTTAKIVPAIDFDHPDDSVEIARWRKHPNLHGWMEMLYRRKGGKGDFNCVTLQIDAVDLAELEIAVNSNQLPSTKGFFFGYSTPADKVDDLKFIEDAKGAIERGFKVFYDSWW